MKISRVMAIAKKQILLNLRFKWGYIFRSIINPIRLGLLFFFIYTGFFYSGAKEIDGITGQNYIVFLVLGTLLANLFNSGFNLFTKAFMQEKWWQTIQGLLISPAKKIEMILGFGIGALIDILPISLLALIFAYILVPISIIQFLYFLILISLTYLIILGFAFITAAFVLSNENISSLLQSTSWVIIFLSCFYYPINSLPKFIHPLVNLNPLYHANWSIKVLWIYGTLHIKSLFWLFFFALISLSVGIYVFNKIWKKIGIEGY